MPFKQTKTLEIADRRLKVAALYLRGNTQHAIAAELGVSQPLIALDLKAIREEWKQSRLDDFSERQDQELAKIDALETVAWQAWERSCKDAEALHESTTKGRATKNGAPLPDLEKSSRTLKGQSGDPRFLERVAWCIERRCKILGIDAPEKHEHDISLDERRTRLAGIIAALRERAGSATDRDPLGGVSGGSN